MTKMTKWTSFWYESNTAWGWISSKDEWEELKGSVEEVFPGVTGDYFKDAKRCDDAVGNEFGFRSEHRGKETLGEFFEKNGMEI